MNTIVTAPRTAAGEAAATTLYSVADSGTAPVFVVAIFVLLLGVLYVLDVFTPSRSYLRVRLVALLIPLLTVYVLVMVFEALLLLRT